MDMIKLFKLFSLCENEISYNFLIKLLLLREHDIVKIFQLNGFLPVEIKFCIMF